MIILPYLNFFCATAYMFLAVFILLKNPKSRLNRLCALIFMAFVFWCLGKTITHNPNIPKEVAVYPMKFVIVGAWLFSGVLLWFTLLFTEKEKLLGYKWFYFLLFGIPTIGILNQWFYGNVIDYVHKPFGWGIEWRDSILTHVLLIHFFLTIFLSVVLMLHFGIKAVNPIKKKQARIIGTTLLIGFIFGYGSNILIPKLTHIVFPDTAHNMALVWAIGLVYAMAKYNFLTISPAMAAEKIISTMSDALFLTSPEGEIVTANRATRDLLGYEADELDKLNIDAFLTTDIPFKSSGDAVETNWSKRNRAVVFKSKNGSRIPVMFSSSPLIGDDRLLVGFVCIARDISEQKASEEAIKTAYTELKATQAQLVQSAKLASIGELASGIAHELNQPLTVIRGHVQFIRRNLRKSKPDLHDLNGKLKPIERNTKRMMKIIDHLRIFSRQSDTVFRPVELNKIVEDCLLMIGEQLRLNDIDVIMRLDHNLPKINGNTNQLEQVFLNLIANARDSVIDKRENGKIQNHASGVDKIEIETSESDDSENTIEICVKDTGMGIDPENIEKLYDPFFTTKKIGEGTGLGLSISYGIVKGHNGDIEILETGPEGTIFRIKLPINDWKRN